MKDKISVTDLFVTTSQYLSFINPHCFSKTHNVIMYFSHDCISNTNIPFHYFVRGCYIMVDNDIKSICCNEVNYFNYWSCVIDFRYSRFYILGRLFC
jgi:hypothetical protein